jgi:hypothetical protein
MRPLISIDAIEFPTGEADDALRSHPVGTMANGALIGTRGLYPQIRSTKPVEMTLTIRRLDEAIERVWLRGAAPAGSVIGGVQETQVRFTKDLDTAVARVLAGQSFDNAPVRKHELKWQWTARASASGQWQDVSGPTETSIVYTTIKAPNAPWGTTRSDALEPPWYEALDFACEWARGSRTVESVIEQITRRVHEHPDLKYAANRGQYVILSQHRPDRFDCAGLIEYLSNPATGAPTVDCQDVASTVCTFANLLGSDLAEDGVTFEDGGATATVLTGPARGIGSTDLHSFRLGFHEVAWRATGDADADVWDAALAFGEDAKLAIAMPFREYAPILVGAGTATAVPDRAHPKRRRVARGVRRFSGEQDIVEPPVPVLDAFRRPGFLPGWTCKNGESETIPEGIDARLFFSQDGVPEHRILVEIVECPTVDDAHSALKWLLKSNPATCASDPAALACRPGFGDEVYVTDPPKEPEDDVPETLFYVRVGRWIARISSAGVRATRVREQAAIVARQLASLAPA